jgi:hypothetical protein
MAAVNQALVRRVTRVAVWFAAAAAMVGLASGVALAESPVPSTGSERAALAYLEGGSLQIGDHLGQSPATVITASGFDGWSPSGRYLAVRQGYAEPALNNLESLISQTGVVVSSLIVDDLRFVSWSPAADELLTVSNPTPSGSSVPAPEIRLYRPDGTLIRTIPTPEGVSRITEGVSWDPDGTRFVVGGCIGCTNITDPEDWPVSGGTQWDLWVIQADGSGSQRITNTWSEVEIDPAWSPDGSVISFQIACAQDINNLPCTDGVNGIWLIEPDGSNRHWITDMMAVSPIWSTDGRQIAFSIDPVNGGIDRIGVTGGNPVAVTRSPSQWLAPLAWTADDQILFRASTPGDPSAASAEVWVVQADGSGATRLGTGWISPMWQP